MKLNIYVTISLFLFSTILFSCEKDKAILDEVEVPNYIHESYDITQEILKDIISDQPIEIQSAILADPYTFLSLVKEALNLPDEYLVLVDKQHALEKDKAPSELEDLANWPEMKTWFGSMPFDANLFPLLQQIDADSKEDGVVLTFTEGYRSYEKQEFNYNYWVQKDGQEMADRTSAQPGKSQHQLGTVVDFGNCEPEFINSIQGQWVMNNMPKYGFSLSYPDGYEELTGYMFECWHWRYISPVGVELQEKFFMDIQQYLTLFWNSKRELLKSYLTE